MNILKRRILTMTLALILVMAAATCAAAAQTLQKPKLNSVTKAASSTTMKVSWYKVEGADGYQIQYSTSTAYKNPKTVKASGNATVSKTIKGLGKSRNYMVRVRAYKKSGSGYVYSGWNAGCKVIAWHKKWKYAKNSSYHGTPAVLYYTDKKNKKGKIVALNAGHGSKSCKKKNLCHPDGTKKVTGGSTGKGAKYAQADNGGAKNEAARMLTLAKKTKKQLLNEGYDVLMLRQTSGVSMDVIARTVYANNNADCHIALHYDSTSSNKGAFFCSVPNVKSYRSMYPVSKHYKQHNRLGTSLISGFRSEGVKIWSDGKMPIDLMQTSFSTIPSSDLEVGDCGTKYTTARYNKMAKGIVKGVNRFFE